MKLLFLGDSITGWSDLAHYLKFSHIVDLMLQAKFGKQRITVLNRGFGGDTTAKVLARIERDVLAERPDIVVLLIGGNEAGEQVPHSTVAQNLQAILTALETIGARVLLLQYHLLPNPESPQTAWSHLAANNDLVAEMGAIHGLPVLDMQAPMQTALRSHAVAELVSPIDGVHLSPGGELVYAQAIFEKLIELVWLYTCQSRHYEALTYAHVG